MANPIAMNIINDDKTVLLRLQPSIIHIELINHLVWTQKYVVQHKPESISDQ